MTTGLEYRPPMIVVVGKQVLDRLETLLPRGLFALVYRVSFNSFRTARRILYLRRWLLALVTLRFDRLRRSSTVFRMMPHSLVGWSGLEATYDCVHAVRQRGLQGALVECGVAQGGCAGVMALADAQHREPRHLWLFDSYEGLPDPSELDFEQGRTGAHLRPLPKGSCLGTIEQVSELLFDDLKIPRERATLVKGWFENTLAPNKAAVGTIALLRIDADWYESVKCCLETFYDSVAPGGEVIIDDYGTCFGAEKAVDEFRGARGIASPMISDGRGGVHFTKPTA
jgi:hypothetical protein